MCSVYTESVKLLHSQGFSNDSSRLFSPGLLTNDQTFNGLALNSPFKDSNVKLHMSPH